jgi:thiamine transport system permease protein
VSVRIPRGIAGVALAISGAFVVFGLVFPLGAVAWRVAGGGALFEAEIAAVAWATFRQAALSTGISALVGLPLGLFVGALDSRSRERVLAWLRVPYGVPTIVAATAWIACLGRTGWLAPFGLDLAYSFTAVIIAHVFFNAPWIALLVAEARAELPESLVDAARTLGAGPRARFAAVLWPAVRGACAAAAAQAFALCSMSFALVLVLGGGPPVDTLETSLYFHVRMGSLDLSGASACAVWELALTLLPWLCVLLSASPVKSARHQAAPAAGRGPARASPMRARAALGLALLFVAPYTAVFAPGAVRALASAEALAPLGGPLLLSLSLAALSACGALAVAASALLAAAWLGRQGAGSRAARAAARGLELAVTVPAGVSVLVLGLGIWLAYARWIDPLSGSLTAIAGLQIVIFTPLAFRALWPVAARGSGTLLEAASTLGASPVRAFFAVEWPRWSGPLRGAAALVAGASLGEVAAVSLFYSEKLIPLPLVISRWMAQYRFAEAQGLSALLLLLSVAVVLVFGRGARHVA